MTYVGVDEVLWEDRLAPLAAAETAATATLAEREDHCGDEGLGTPLESEGAALCLEGGGELWVRSELHAAVRSEHDRTALWKTDVTHVCARAHERSVEVVEVR